MVAKIVVMLDLDAPPALLIYATDFASSLIKGELCGCRVSQPFIKMG